MAWVPQALKFGRTWIGPYKVLSRNGVNYKLEFTLNRTLIAHRNLLKHCPIPIDKVIPFHPAPETPGVTVLEVSDGGPGTDEPRIGRGRPPDFPFCVKL